MYLNNTKTEKEPFSSLESYYSVYWYRGLSVSIVLSSSIEPWNSMEKKVGEVNFEGIMGKNYGSSIWTHSSVSLIFNKFLLTVRGIWSVSYRAHGKDMVYSFFWETVVVFICCSNSKPWLEDSSVPWIAERSLGRLPQRL